MKIDGYDHRGNRTSVHLDDLLFSYLAAQVGGDQEARHWIKGSMSEVYLGMNGPTLSKAVSRMAMAEVVKPSLKRRAEEIQADIEDL